MDDARCVANSITYDRIRKAAYIEISYNPGRKQIAFRKLIFKMDIAVIFIKV